ncbi:hypothetical protein ACP4OV_027889 [Aristida adscensionis]
MPHGRGRGGGEEEEAAEAGEDFELAEALVKADFWLLFAGYFIGVGTGITVLNNLAQIGAAAGIADSTLFAVPVRPRQLPRPAWRRCNLGEVCDVNAAGTPADLDGGDAGRPRRRPPLPGVRARPGVVHACAAGIGVCYGVQFAVMIPTTSELFGLRNFGLFYNLVSLANPLGAVLFSEELAGRLYDDEAVRQRRPGGGGDAPQACLGPGCFTVAFVVLAGACALGTAASLVLAAS